MCEKIRPYFPMFVDIWEKKIVIIGGGGVAARRLQTLLQFSENIVLIAPEVDNRIYNLQQEYPFEIILEEYKQEYILDADMVLSATNNSEVDNQIYGVCKCLGIQVNISSDKSKCDFYFPGVVRDTNLVIGVTSSGTDYSKTKRAVQNISSLYNKNEKK